MKINEKKTEARRNNPVALRAAPPPCRAISDFCKIEFFWRLKKSELAGMFGVTFVGTTYRRVPKLRHEVEWFVELVFCLYFFLFFFNV